jgi:hypothetical protein
MSILHNAPDGTPITAPSKPTESTSDKVLDVTSQVGQAAHKGLSYSIARRERANEALNES